MFGYIKPFKPELRLKEYDTYKAVYCGLCHEMGASYGPFARFTLSYDFTFAALLGLALQEEFHGFQMSRCMAHPMKKRPRAASCETLSLVSACAMSMLHQKLRDNMVDSGPVRRLGCRMACPFTRRMEKKAVKAFPPIGPALGSMMERQLAVEADPGATPDAAAEPTASALSQMFVLLSDDPVKQRVLSRMGYLMGRWVYFIDALDDLEDDAKDGSFNPFLRRFDPDGQRTRDGLPPELRQEILESATGTLNLTVGELAGCYELLDLKRYKTILDNVIYMGLTASMRQVVEQRGERKLLPGIS